MQKRDANVQRVSLGMTNVQATRLARAMVTKYGMSEALGKVAINYEDNGRSVSSETRNLVETEVSPYPTSKVLCNKQNTCIQAQN